MNNFSKLLLDNCPSKTTLMAFLVSYISNMVWANTFGLILPIGPTEKIPPKLIPTNQSTEIPKILHGFQNAS